MRCCVPSCKNDSRHTSKSQGITFHVFPNESSLRKSWVKALGKESWEPRERSVVCSEHFLCEDLYETKNGLWKVRAGAVPLVVQDSSNYDYAEPASLKACRICLVMDVKLFHIRIHKLQQAYENLTGISLCEEDKLPQKLCMECVQRLMNCSRFRLKSLRANSLMLDVIKKQDCLTVQNIKTINRSNNQLTSTLTTKHFEVNHCDSYIEYEDQPKINQDEENVKMEYEIFLTDDVTDKNDELNDQEFDDDGITDVFKDEDDIDISEKEYELSVKDNYSSDDSLPLEKCKTRKTRKRKEKETKLVKAVKRVKKEKDPAEPKIDRRRKPFLSDDLNESLFTIDNLTVEEQIAEIVRRQDSDNYRNSYFKCTECFKGFLDEDAYNSHMSRHTNQCGEYECDICKTHFKHSNALRKHITAHHTQRFNCTRCTFVTTHRQTARLHERWHKGTKYSCPHCQEEFVKFTTYMGHVRIKHPSDFVCELCGYSFVSAKGKDLHKKLKHRLDNKQIPEDGPLCELCNVRFVSSEAHMRHLNVSARHNTDTNKDSRESNKPKKGRIPNEYSRRTREGKDSDGKRRIFRSQVRKAIGPIPCEQCGIQLEDSRAYHGHFRRMHPDKNRTKYPSMKSPCMCEVCGKMFQSYALLKDHTWVHTGERPFKCDSCGKSFRMKQRLVTHRRVHSKERASYACSLCGKQFSTHSNRQRHMFIHTGLKPYQCEMCGKGFKHSSEKRAHITYVHLKKPWPKRARGKRRSDTKQVQIPQDQDTDMEAPVWHPGDPKIGEMEPLIEEKPVYYILKI